MSLIITPRQFAHRAELYNQLSQLTAAGIGLLQALEMQRRSPPARSFREPLSRWIERLHQGSTFGEAVQSTGHWLPAFDAALLQAGERSGRLPACFKLLSNYYQERARLTRQILSDLAYPLFLFHFAIFIGPIPDLFKSGSVIPYLVQTLGVLLPIYVLVALLIYATQGQHGERWRALIETIMRGIPILGKARRNLALARLAAALEALITAGVSIVEAWELAATASGSPALRRAVVSWTPQVLAGQTPAEAASQSPEVPELFANMYHTGEVTGQLDDTLHRLHTLYQEEGTAQLRLIAEWTPKLIYFGIMLMIAYRVISFWSGYYGQNNDVMK